MRRNYMDMPNKMRICLMRIWGLIWGDFIWEKRELEKT